MSEVVQGEHVAALPGLTVAGGVKPELPRATDIRARARRLLRLDRDEAQLVAAGGRVAVVWLPAFAYSTTQFADGWTAFFWSTVVMFAWSVALRGAFSAARSTLFAVGVVVAAAVGTATGLVVVSALNAWLPWLSFSPMELLQMAVAIFLLSAIWESVVQASTASEQRVLLVGASDETYEIIEQIVQLHDSPFEVVGIVVDDDEFHEGELARLPEIVASHQPDLVVMANRRPQTFDALLDVASAGFKVVAPPEFFEHAFGRVPVRAVNQSWFMHVLHLYRKPYTRVAKRIFDLVVASVGIVLTAPLWPLIAFAVSRTPGPIVFRQLRLGEGGKPFTIFKFRTMRADAEAHGAVWAAERDPRITRAGAFLRKTRLDELPQLVNVLRGEMSIVGPRPERPEFVPQLQEALPFWSRRHLVKPGITGWAQVRRGYTADAEGTAEKLAYDLWYLRHRSLVLDLAICVKTFTTLVTGDGAR
ncbi:MAG TPA: sugar transferase [Gaiellaceae bacterium]|nr:sugar transferase [Gaiellaceae bacterium]